MFGSKQGRVRDVIKTFYADTDGEPDVETAASLLRRRLTVPIDDHIHLFYAFTMALMQSIDGDTPLAPVLIDFMERLDARLKVTEPSAPAMRQYRQACERIIRQFLAGAHEGLNITTANIRMIRSSDRARSLNLSAWEAIGQIDPDSLRTLQDMPVNAGRLAACAQDSELRESLESLRTRCHDLRADAQRQ